MKFVTICGEAKGSISQHIRKFHNMTVKQYLAAYPGAEVHCNKVKVAFSDASKKKWQTQFSNGTSVPAKKKEPKKDDGITKELIEKYFMDGCNCSEIGRMHNVSGSTVVNRCKQFVIEIPSVAVLKIRKAVKNGAELNLESASLEEIDAVVKECGKSGALRKYGVEKDLFNSWMTKLAEYNKE